MNIHKSYTLFLSSKVFVSYCPDHLASVVFSRYLLRLKITTIFRFTFQKVTVRCKTCQPSVTKYCDSGTTMLGHNPNFDKRFRYVIKIYPQMLSRTKLGRPPPPHSYLYNNDSYFHLFLYLWNVDIRKGICLCWYTFI